MKTFLDRQKLREWAISSRIQKEILQDSLRLGGKLSPVEPQRCIKE